MGKTRLEYEMDLISAYNQKNDVQFDKLLGELLNERDRLIEACQAGLARIESDIESPGKKYHAVG